MEEILVDMLREINYFNGKLAEVKGQVNTINSKYEKHDKEIALLSKQPDDRSLNTRPRSEQRLYSPDAADNGDNDDSGDTCISVSDLSDVYPKVPSRQGAPSRGGLSRDDVPSRDDNLSRDGDLSRDDVPSRGDTLSRDGGPSRSGDRGPSREGEPNKDGDPDKVDTFEEFSGYTTLHGLRYIGDRTSILPRRCFWVLLVMLCLSLACVQLADRFEYFLSSPSNVKFEVNYPETIDFPAVTFCNQNNFRISKAYEGGWQNFLIDYYHNKVAMPASSEPHLNTSLTHMFEDLAHAKEDFIVKCQWADEECSAANFTTTLTSNGVCYTFNKVGREGHARKVQASGAAHALRLTLNTENYERLKGPLDTTGIKMLMTDQNEVPRMEEIGTALSTGVHAFVGISVLTLSNLPAPHGECGEVPLVTTDSYNQHTCLLECETLYAYSTCGCRHFYMPDLTGELPVCSVEQFLKCLQSALNRFNSVRSTVCTCPVSCLYNIYEPSVSYATSAQLADSVKNDGANETLVKERFFASNEIASKIEESLHGDFGATIVSTIQKVKQMAVTIRDRMALYNHNQFGLEEYSIINTLLPFRQFRYQYLSQLLFLKDKLMPDRDRMEENTLQFVCHDFNSFIGEVQDKIHYLVRFNQDDLSVAKYIYYGLESLLRNKQNTLARALDEFAQLVIDYKQEIILTFSDSFWTEFETVLDKQIQDILNINESVSDMKAHVIELFEDSVIHISGTRLETLITDFQNACTLFMVDKTTFYSVFIDGLARSLEEKDVNASAWDVRYNFVNDEAKTYLFVLVSFAAKLADTGFPSLVDELLGIQSYLNGSLPLSTKYNIANTQSLELKLNDVQAIIDNLESYISINIFHGVKYVIMEFRDLFCPTADYGCDYGNILNILGYLETTELEYRTLLARTDDDIDALQSVASIVDELREYHAGHAMDEDFYRRNFMYVDVYFKELRNDVITQQEDYDEISLLCDIGGATGLFIGGSVITVFEIAEFLLMCCVCKMCFKRAKRCNCKVVPSE